MERGWRRSKAATTNQVCIKPRLSLHRFQVCEFVIREAEVSEDLSAENGKLNNETMNEYSSDSVYNLFFFHTLETSIVES